MKKLILLFILLSSRVEAACYTYTFESPPTYPTSNAPVILSTPYSVWASSVTTMITGPGWQRSEDEYNSSGDPIRAMFTNQPSGDFALYHDQCTVSTGCDFGNFVFIFDPPVKHISFKYTGRFFWEYWQSSPPAWIVNTGSLPFTVHF